MKYESEALKVIHQDAKAMYKIGAITEARMREYDEICLPNPKTKNKSSSVIKSELEQIPGIGKNMAQHLINAGYPTIASLKGQNPEEIYFKDCKIQNTQVDRCALYVYRLAVAYANGTITDPEKLKWWNWKD